MRAPECRCTKGWAHGRCSDISSHRPPLDGRCTGGVWATPPVPETPMYRAFEACHGRTGGVFRLRLRLSESNVRHAWTLPSVSRLDVKHQRWKIKNYKLKMNILLLLTSTKIIQTNNNSTWFFWSNFLIQFSYHFERSDHNYHYDWAVTFSPALC